MNQTAHTQVCMWRPLALLRGRGVHCPTTSFPSEKGLSASSLPAAVDGWTEWALSASLAARQGRESSC